MFKISIEELQTLLNYLQRKPYIEVIALIPMIQKLQRLEKEKEIDDEIVAKYVDVKNEK